MTSKSNHAVELGYAGEQAVKAELESRGHTVEDGPLGSYDLLVNGRITVEVKTALLSGRTDKDAMRYQFCLYAHPERQKPLEEDILILRCACEDPVHFIIPAIVIPDGLTKIDITSTDPRRYKGRWEKYREAWYLIEAWEASYCVP